MKTLLVRMGALVTLAVLGWIAMARAQRDGDAADPPANASSANPLRVGPADTASGRRPTRRAGGRGARPNQKAARCRFQAGWARCGSRRARADSRSVRAPQAARSMAGPRQFGIGPDCLAGQPDHLAGQQS